ncbi:hypothetical protein VSH64_47745 [Amycolatopsis rhabdoformis]|uniref:Uncharacterized protein n=1 Tax=Amycolatopsis rhabdoformis TaxID=1448059 RepID=A0ABZ1I9I1_9PSEU|nr:hypothetical protein [Amycolatopsis rhabdoformis]WSE30401.1 hypothetical protein VSH64_47745 [Amycolatopsis rhabdoformis]
MPITLREPPPEVKHRHADHRGRSLGLWCGTGLFASRGSLLTVGDDTSRRTPSVVETESRRAA